MQEKVQGFEDTAIYRRVQAREGQRSVGGALPSLAAEEEQGERLTKKQLLQFFELRTNEADEWTAEKLAAKFELSEATAGHLLQHYSVPRLVRQGMNKEDLPFGMWQSARDRQAPGGEFGGGAAGAAESGALSEAGRE